MKTMQTKITRSLFPAITALVICPSVLLASPQSKKTDTKKPTAKLINVWTCPIQLEKISDHKSEAGKPEVVGNYRVHFCCAGCDTDFAKLSAKDKKAKAEAAYKKDIAKSTTGEKKDKG